MTTEFLKSVPVTNLDATPVVVSTAGEGSPGMMKVATDFVGTTTVGGIGSTYRLARIPTNAKVKRVRVYTKGIDTNAAPTWAADVNIAFSDSTQDGTSPNVQAAIPTNLGTGTTTTVAAYVNPNKLFGAALALAGAAGAAKETDVTFSGPFTPANRDDDLWDVFGFANNQGVAQDPGGFFDILLVVSTAAATPANGTIGVEVDFVV